MIGGVAAALQKAFGKARPAALMLRQAVFECNEDDVVPVPGHLHDLKFFGLEHEFTHARHPSQLAKPRTEEFANL